MKVNIYYGGRGILDDPTIYVINKMQAVLEELNVIVERFNLFEMKNTILTLPQTLKNADGIILATTVEWHGIGGYMSQFLDACWLYGDKDVIGKLYMCPVTMSTTYGEREGKLDLQIAWEILGGLPCSGLCGYISDTTQLEMNDDYLAIIERKTENLYRTINQKMASFPASNQAVKQKISITKNINFTPQESEQLSQYVSDDSYVQTQKEDIKELASFFKEKLEKTEIDDTVEYIKDLEDCYKPTPGFKATYKFVIEGRKKPLIIEINSKDLKVYYGSIEKQDVEAQIKPQIFDEIISGRMTFQRAFMGGSMTMKGDFKALRTLDQVFPFIER